MGVPSGCRVVPEVVPASDGDITGGSATRHGVPPGPPQRSYPHEDADACLMRRHRNVSRVAAEPPESRPFAPATERVVGWSPRRGPAAAIRAAVRARPRVARRLLAFLLVIPLVVGVAAPPRVSGDELASAQARQQALQQKIADQKAEVARLQGLQAGLASDIASTNRALGGINADLAATKKRISGMTTKIAAVQAVYTDLVGQLGLLDRQVVALGQEQAEKAQELADRKAMLAARVREAYRTDRTPIIQQLLAAGSISDVLQDVGSYLDLGGQDQAMAARITQDQQALDALQALLVATRAAKDDLRQHTLAQKRQLDGQMADLRAANARLAALQAETARQLAIQRATWAKISKNAASAKQALAADAKAQRELAAQIATLLERQRQFGNVPSAFNGTLRWPLSGRITQDFGCTGFAWEPPSGSCSHFHQGIDIVAPAVGTPVRAAADGVVLFVGFNGNDPPGSQAWIVVIAHAQSLQTWYAHGQPIAPPGVYAGATVQAGQVIMYEGCTGMCTGPHLHWAVWSNGDFVNPRLFV
jgi:murein DD-endopeptidase MepM/ murein hydrolase activator NlpD